MHTHTHTHTQAVWKPMAFVYLYNLLQVPNVAWQSYLQLTLEFPAWILGLVSLIFKSIYKSNFKSFEDTGPFSATSPLLLWLAGVSRNMLQDIFLGET